jgi:hypothetical protein
VLMGDEVRNSPRFKEQLLQGKEDESWLRRLNSLPLERRIKGYIQQEELLELSGIL